ncbi:response regulator [Chitinimonas sp. BJB300]|uniref:response regulator n=1 Tax=Chitinimonas sp. BJB300 TaxID=1559339 RepID=UPI000C113C8C|nr:response regulator transcription factor [Chitinimonas sp. BJB300]PHV12922.1 DNA-binding response regulator [Chitinimonas sp. BJB300]TSJ88491.1 response regulator transcription factor [Chitinimonas sp. BJB300]
MRILLAEDDPALQRGLREALNRMGYQSVVVGNGEHADTLLASEQFDLLVLDLGLPGLDGLDVLRRLRSRRQPVPVLILSARDRLEDRIAGLNGGADDYLTKPFDLTEFEARVRAQLRRGHGAITVLGSLEWHWQTRQAIVNGQLLTLSAKDSVLLESLLQQAGKVVNKETLAWRMGDTQLAAGENTVEVYIHRLRRKLAPAGLVILTVRGVGYFLQETPDAV